MNIAIMVTTAVLLCGSALMVRWLFTAGIKDKVFSVFGSEVSPMVTIDGGRSWWEYRYYGDFASSIDHKVVVGRVPRKAEEAYMANWPIMDRLAIRITRKSRSYLTAREVRTLETHGFEVNKNVRISSVHPAIG